MICLFLLLVFMESQSQHRYRQGSLPSININKKVNSLWKLNLKIESRQPFRIGTFGQPAETKFQYERADFTLLTSRKIGANSKAAAGMMLRFRDGDLIHRSIQQYSVVRRYPGFRLGQRFSTDQTFAPQTATQYRFRYRIGADFALNGQAVDHREFYLKLTNEYLTIIQEEIDLEIRLVPTLGYAYTDNNKLELGLDYRLDSILAQNLRSNFWFTVGWFVAIS